MPFMSQKEMRTRWPGKKLVQVKAEYGDNEVQFEGPLLSKDACEAVFLALGVFHPTEVDNEVLPVFKRHIESSLCGCERSAVQRCLTLKRIEISPPGPIAVDGPTFYRLTALGHYVLAAIMSSEERLAR